MLWKRMLRLLLVTGVIVSMHCTALSQPKPADATSAPLMARLSGTVVTRDAIPIPGVTVQVVLPDPMTGDKPGTSVVASAVSGAMGTYVLPPVPVQPSWILAETTGCRTFAKPLVELESARRDAERGEPFPVRLNIQMRPTAFLEGRLIDADGTSVSAARVALETIPGVVRGPGYIHYPSSRGSYRDTDKDGRFRFEEMLPGTYLFSAIVPNRVPFRQRVTVPGEPLIARLSSGGASIEGTVLIKPSGEGCAGATVSLSPKLSNPVDATERAAAPSARSAIADANGRFALMNLEPGTYSITASGDTLKPASQDDPRGAEIAVAPGQAVRGVEVFVYGGHALRGVVVDKDTGLPLSGVTIKSGYLQERSGIAATTGEDGAFELSPVYAWGGNARLQVISEGYSMPPRRSDRNGVIWYDAKVPNDIMDAVLRLELERDLSISGRLLDEDGRPVPGTTVTLHDEGLNPRPFAEAMADDDGTFIFPAPQRGNYRVRAALPGYAVALSDQIALKDANATGLVVRLARGVEAAGSVTDPDGAPVAGAGVAAMFRIRREGTNAIRQMEAGRTKTGGDGSFVLACLPVTSCTIAAYKSGFTPSKKTAIEGRTDGDRIVVQLQLRAPHFLAGRVTDSAGKPVGQVFVSVVAANSGDDSSGHATTDEEGRYRVDFLADVAHDVYISDNAHGYAKFTGVAVDRADADFKFSPESK